MKQTFYTPFADLAAAGILGGCSGMNALLKSGKPELIYSKAMEYYQKEKWPPRRSSKEPSTTTPAPPPEDSISFFNARCKFKNRDYDTASTLLDDFRRKFGRSAFIEDAEGMYASASTTSRRDPRATRR